MKLDYECTECRLHETRIQVVWGSGNLNSKLCFMGEGPGREEDEQGEAFVGQAGDMLIRILKLLKITRQDILILNLVKCRPPNNRNPRSDEIAACRTYLNTQIMEAKNLNTIVALGRVPWKGLTGRSESVTALHGSTVKIGRYLYLYTYHPSYLLRNQTVELKYQFLRDIRKALYLSGMRNIKSTWRPS